MAKPRRHRLELPAPPRSSDQAAVERYLADVRRLTMDEFNRLASDYFDFQQEVINSAVVPLASVAAISVVPGQYTAVFTWENPAQQFGDPTHVRVRIAEFGDTWLEYAYPITTWTANGLNPDTDYTFQIQLVRREQATVSFVSALRNCPSLPVIVESTSEIRSRSFQTLPGVGVPTPDDDGDPVVPIPDTDNPGPVGGTDCWWEWQIQVVNLVTGDWDDTIYGGFVAGDADNIDLTAIMPLLDPLRVYRMKVREICNGVPGPWEYGPPWTGGDDWADNCGGLDPSASYLTEPYASADLWVIPYLCFVAGEGLFIREYLSGVEIVPGDASKNLSLDAEGEWVWFSEEWTDTPNTRLLGSTFIIPITELDNTNDLTIEFQIKLPDFPDLSGMGPFGTDNLINIGDGRIFFHVTWDNLGRWGIQFMAPREIGGSLTLNSPLVSTGGLTDWTKISVRIDNDGDKILYVDNIEVASDTTGQEIRLDGMTGTMQIRALSGMRLRSFYGWSSLIDFAPDLIHLSDISLTVTANAATVCVMFNPAENEMFIAQFGAAADGRVTSWDISDPENPVLLDSDTSAESENANFGFYQSGFLWLSTSVNDVMASYSVANANAISIVDTETITGAGGGGFLPMPIGANHIVDGGSTTLSHTDGRLHTFTVNFATGAISAFTASATIAGMTQAPSTLKLSDTRIVAYNGQRMCLVDVSIPTAPVILTNIATTIEAGVRMAVSPSGNYLYAPKPSDGTIDILDPFNSFAVVDNIPGFTSNGGSTVDGDWMVLTSTAQMAIVNVTDELNPIVGTPIAESPTGRYFTWIDATLRIVAYADVDAFEVRLYSF